VHLPAHAHGAGCSKQYHVHAYPVRQAEAVTYTLVQWST
jgi:hypothetical protein